METNSEGRTRAEQFVCDEKGAMRNFYNASSCTGTPAGSEPVTLGGNGKCSTGGCAGFTRTSYSNGDCQGKAAETTTNDFIYWGGAGCNYNSTTTCKGSVPTVSFFNNTACTGEARHVMVAGECQKHNSKQSEEFTVTPADNPCA